MEPQQTSSSATKTNARCAGQTCDLPAGVYCFEQLEARLLLDALPIAPELWASDPVPGVSGLDSGTSAVAMDADGDSVVVWECGYGTGLLGRFFDANGRALDPVINLVGWTEDNVQVSHPSVAMDADGDFVLAWQKYDYYVMEGGVYVQRFAPDGTPSGGELLVADAPGVNSPAVAVDADGDFVVVWQQYYGETGLFARFYSGETGSSPTLIVTPEAGWQSRDASVAMDADGDFVVAWREYFPSYYPYPMQNLLLAQRFDSGGTPAGAELTIAPHDEQSMSYSPSVGMDDDGDFVITWAQYNSSWNSEWTIFAQRYDSSANPNGWRMIVADHPQMMVRPSAAMDADGDFAITWQHYDSYTNDYDILARRYDSSGAALRSPFYVTGPGNPEAFGPTSHMDPDVAMDADGDMLVVWQRGAYGEGGILGQFVTSDGQSADPIFQLVMPVSMAGEVAMLNPSVAMDADGDFIVTWQMGYSGQGGVWGQLFDATAQPVGSALRLVRPTGQHGEGNSTDPSVAMDADGDFIVVWVSGAYYDTAGILGQRFNAAGAPQSPVIELVDLMGYANETTSSSVAMDDDGDFVVAWRGYYGYYESIFAQQFAPDGTPSGGPTPVIGSMYGYYPSVAMDMDGDFLVAWSVGYAGNHGTMARRYSSAGLPQGPAFQLVAPAGYGSVRDPAVAMDADGDLAVAWQHYDMNYNTGGVLAQRFGADDMPDGSRFWVSPLPSGYSESISGNPSVAMDADGDTLVVWESGYYGVNGISGQFFDAEGKTVGPVYGLVVPTGTARSRNPSVAMDPLGNFVITWREYDSNTSLNTLIAHRYESDGTPVGAELVVAAGYMGDAPRYPSVAMDDDGDFLIVWQEYYGQGGLLGRLFDANGQAQGPAVVIAPAVPGMYLQEPAVAMDADGDFVVAWEQYGIFVSEVSLLAQRFSSAGTAVGAEILVDYSDEWDTMPDSPAVAMDSDGDFVVAWDEYYGQSGVFFQQFNSAGNTVGEVGQLVDTRMGMMRRDVAVVMDDAGELFVAWEQYDSYGNMGQDILARRFELASVSSLPADLDGDGFVGQGDLDIILGQWGRGEPSPPNDPITDGRADPSGDGFVGQEDLDIILGAWGQETQQAESQSDEKIIEQTASLESGSDADVRLPDRSEATLREATASAPAKLAVLVEPVAIDQQLVIQTDQQYSNRAKAKATRTKGQAGLDDDSLVDVLAIERLRAL